MFAPVDPRGATGRLAELFAAVKHAWGVIPNMPKAMANSPALLDGYLALRAALYGPEAALPLTTRELLAIATAEYNGCQYCLSAHTYRAGKLAGVDQVELEKARVADSSDPHTAALLQLSDAILRRHGHVDDDTLRAACDAGVTEAEIGELVGHIALRAITNYFNIVARVDNDWPVVRLHRETADQPTASEE